LLVRVIHFHISSVIKVIYTNGVLFWNSDTLLSRSHHLLLMWHSFLKLPWNLLHHKWMMWSLKQSVTISKQNSVIVYTISIYLCDIINLYLQAKLGHV